MATGGEGDANFIAYKNIAAFTTMAVPKVPYPEGKEALMSKEIRHVLEDLLEVKVEARLGCRSEITGVGVMDELQNEDFFKGFSFNKVRDESFPAPYATQCKEELDGYFKAAKEKTTVEKFDAPAYVGDNRWCDDWDYTCTVGAVVESGKQENAGPVMNGRRKSQASLGVSVMQGIKE